MVLQLQEPLGIQAVCESCLYLQAVVFKSSVGDMNLPKHFGFRFFMLVHSSGEVPAAGAERVS